MTTLFPALLLAFLAVAAGLRILLLRYAPSPMARKLRAVQVSLALRHFRVRVLFLRSRELRMLSGYRECIRELEVAVILRNGFEERAAKYGPRSERIARQTDEYAIIERYYDRKLRQAATFLGHMPDAQLQSIATSIRDEVLEGMVPVSTVADFLKGERKAIREASHMAVGHYGRMMARMREIKAAVLLGAIGGLAGRR